MVEVVEQIEIKEAPVELDEVGNHLLRARDYIRKHGWCQNDLLTESGQACVLGALAMTSESSVVYTKARLRFVDSVGLPYGGQYGISPIANWNDTTDRTQKEVEERLERAAYNL